MNPFDIRQEAKELSDAIHNPNRALRSSTEDAIKGIFRKSLIVTGLVVVAVGYVIVMSSPKITK